jgi:hypothetical protein
MRTDLLLLLATRLEQIAEAGDRVGPIGFDMERVFYVYVIFRPDGRPCYVGKGQGGRWEVHFRNARNKHLSNIVAKAGGDLPVVKVRENLTEAEAFKTEVAWIAALGRKKDGGPLVNATDGGDGVSGHVHSLGTRARISEAAKAQWESPEARARLSEVSKAMWQDPETRVRMAKGSKARWESPQARARKAESSKAQWESPEARARLSEASKAMWRTPDFRAKWLAARARTRALKKAAN